MRLIRLAENASKQKQQWILLKKRRSATIIKAEMKLVLRKKPFTMKKRV